MAVIVIQCMNADPFDDFSDITVSLRFIRRDLIMVDHLIGELDQQQG